MTFFSEVSGTVGRMIQSFIILLAGVFLLLSPGGAYAAGTIVLPSGVEAQEILVHCRQAVTALTVTPQPGNTISGAPTTIAAGGFFRLRFDSVESIWARIG